MFICEGEKDANRLAHEGFVATTNPMGAGKWHVDLNPWFVGRDCFILADNDKPGRAHANDVAGHLKSVADTVRIVELPGLPEKGDVSDWLDANPDNKFRLVDVAKAVPVWSPDDGRPAPRGMTAADLKGMVFPPVNYVVQGYISEGLTIFAGKPKIGKSWLCLDVACAVASGGIALGRIQVDQGDVLYAALEDNPRRLQMRMQRLAQFGSWPERLTFWTECPRLDDGGVDAFREWITATRDPKLVIIDVFARVRPAKRANETQYDADYRAVAGLHALASETGVAILVVSHVRKMEAEDPLDTVSGTLGFTGAADTVLVLTSSSQGKVLYGRGRDIEEIETAVKFEADLCRWVVLGEAAEVHRSEERKSIADVLRDSPEPMTPRELADELDHSYEALRKTLQRMARSGEVEKAGRGRYRLRDV